MLIELSRPLFISFKFLLLAFFLSVSILLQLHTVDLYVAAELVQNLIVLVKEVRIDDDFITDIFSVANCLLNANCRRYHVRKLRTSRLDNMLWLDQLGIKTGLDSTQACRWLIDTDQELIVFLANLNVILHTLQSPLCLASGVQALNAKTVLFLGEGYDFSKLL
jgi:hypothetical protein